MFMLMTPSSSVYDSSLHIPGATSAGGRLRYSRFPSCVLHLYFLLCFCDDTSYDIAIRVTQVQRTHETLFKLGKAELIHCFHLVLGPDHL